MVGITDRNIKGAGVEPGPVAAATSSTDSGLLRTGVIGTVVAAICCFTPILVILLGAVGLSALLGWLDFVLLPALAVFAGITVYALWRARRAT